MSLRKPQPVTISADLVPLLWKEIKEARDRASQDAVDAKYREQWLNRLLNSMKAEGMADHLPTIEEVQAAWRGE